METYGTDFLTPLFVIYISKHHHHHYQGNELHFKVSMSIKLQKVFDVYSSKKNLTMSALKFLFDGERLSGDMSPEHLGIYILNLYIHVYIFT
jgi:hypothetical protein